MDVFLSRDFLAQLGIFLARRNMSRLAGRKKIGPSAKTSYKVYFRLVYIDSLLFSTNNVILRSI